MTLLAEDLLLLLLDDGSGALALGGAGLDTALGGAVLLELALGGRGPRPRCAGPRRPLQATVTTAIVTSTASS